MRLLGVSCSTVARWARTGRLRATEPLRGRRYDVGGFLDDRAAAKAEAEAAAARVVRSVEPPAGWLSVADAASGIGISTNPLRRAIQAGELEARRHRGRPIINEDQLQGWIEARRQGGGTPGTRPGPRSPAWRKLKCSSWRSSANPVGVPGRSSSTSSNRSRLTATTNPSECYWAHVMCGMARLDRRL